jgi:sugar O-acyltransferase (sialic acid O-acetyltransferase NeuD family)
MSREPIVIYGTRGVARELNQLIKALVAAGQPIRCEGFLVDEPYRDSATLHGLPVLGGARWFEGNSGRQVIIGIGATPPRYRIAREIEAFGTPFATLIHPQATIGDTVTLAPGSFAAPQAVATTEIAIGHHSQLHAACTIGHDTTIADFVTVAPGANVSGRVEIGVGTFIGAGAVILPDVKVGRWSIVGAGAVVTRDVEDNVTVAGARVIARREPEWHVAAGQ